MGKAVSKGLKYRAEVLTTEMPEKFGGNFETNKKNLAPLELGLSKNSRNVLAGYMARISKKEAKEKVASN
ncbi:MAG: 30S ribosomal protein S17e [Candidatus ainarchaeum sp.]|nr:30S ribosomal protein S17e [Candidatus ainarchaeum sp.]